MREVFRKELFRLFKWGFSCLLFFTLGLTSLLVLGFFYQKLLPSRASQVYYTEPVGETVVVGQGFYVVYKDKLYLVTRTQRVSLEIKNQEGEVLSLSAALLGREIFPLKEFLEAAGFGSGRFFLYNGQAALIESVDPFFVQVVEPLTGRTVFYETKLFTENYLNGKIELVSEEVFQGVEKGEIIPSPSSPSAQGVTIISGFQETVYHSSWAVGAKSVIAAQTSLVHLTDKEPSWQVLDALRSLDFDNPELRKFFDEESIQILKDAYFPKTKKETTALIALNTLSADPVARERAEELISWINEGDRGQRLAIASSDPLLENRAAALVGQKAKVTVKDSRGKQGEYKALVVDVAQTKHSFEMSGLISREEVGVGDQFIVDVVNPEFAKILGWEFDAGGNPYFIEVDNPKTIIVEVETLPEVLLMTPTEQVEYGLKGIVFEIKRLLLDLF